MRKRSDESSMTWYKFTPAKYLAGIISEMKYDLQGVFTLVCCYYWVRRRDVTMTWLKAKLSTCLNLLDELEAKNIIAVDADDYIKIDFLDAQLEDRGDLSKVRSDAGRKGGKAKRKQTKANANIKEKNRTEKNRTEPSSDDASSFNFFWSAYPRKVGKSKAEAAFKKIKMTADLFKKICAAIESQKKSAQWTKDDGQFIPHPATWLNGQRWEDEADVIPIASSKVIPSEKVYNIKD